MDGNFGAGKTRLTATMMLDDIFSTHRRMEEKTDKGWCLVVPSSLFIKCKKKSYTWKDYWKKSKHNKGVEKLRKMYNKEEYAVFD